MHVIVRVILYVKQYRCVKVESGRLQSLSNAKILTLTVAISEKIYPCKF